MSYVWVAHDTGNQADVLLCVPRAQPKTDAERDAWSQEVLLASRLKHPRLAQVLDDGLAADRQRLERHQGRTGVDGITAWHRSPRIK